MSHLGPKVGQIEPKLDKSGTFSDQISVHFGSTFVQEFDQFGFNLTHFGAKSEIADLLLEIRCRFSCYVLDFNTSNY